MQIDLPRLGSLSERLIWARNRAKLTQDQLAMRASVSRDVIAKTESGLTRMPKRIDQIASALEVPAAWLAFGSEEIASWDEDTLAMATEYNRLPEHVKSAVRTLISSASSAAPEDK
ncbi:MAG: helix-turn-helix transcriptional regulator [Thiohalocapsa sp.]